jgi:hypothetical protein
MAGTIPGATQQTHPEVTPNPEVKHGTMFQGSQDTLYSELSQPINKTERLEGDETLALQSMVIRTPDQPILVNGQPYVIAIDKPRLAGRVNNIRTMTVSPGHYDPRGLIIGLNEDAQLSLSSGCP